MAKKKAKAEPEADAGRAEELHRLSQMIESEPLDPELAKCLEGDAASGQWRFVKHPLVVALYAGEPLHKSLNSTLRFKKEWLARSIRDGDWKTVVFLHERAFRVQAFLEHADSMTDRQYWKILGEVWTDSENLWQYRDELDEILASDRGQRCYLMDSAERKVLKSLPPRVRVFRGHNGLNPDGHSWSLSYHKARWFAERFSRPGIPVVTTGFVRRKDIIAVLTGRGEFEVVARPGDVRVKHEYEFTIVPESRFESEWNSICYAEFCSRMGRGAERTIHGLKHWERVREIGSLLCSITKGADALVCRLFAAAHDCCRDDDGDDPEHGRRAANFVRDRREFLAEKLSPRQTDLLIRAVTRHNDGVTTGDPTIGACWDADRLELTRVGVVPDPKLLSTAAGKRHRMMV